MTVTEKAKGQKRARIALCMIVGNVEEYIERCLASFAPIADEICIVRAIGNLAPDRTIDYARAVCLARGIPFRTADYLNEPGHDWPHVDDFAAARQMSFDLAWAAGDGPPDYCFWCDSDDVLESGAEVVRELADRGGYAAFVFPYKIFGRGVTVPRERMISPLAGKWRYPVHECFDFTIQPVQAVEDQRVVVMHLPALSKMGSNTRNRTILQAIPEDQMTPGLWYHLQGELAAAGDEAGSVAAAKQALASPDLGRPERYEMFLNLARMAKKPEVLNTLLHQAYAVDPRRREALGLLVCHALDNGKADDALAYAKAMRAIPRPDFTEWNEREAAYGWLGEEIYTQALRANGHRNEAEVVRRNTLAAAGGPRIALVHATRGRPVQAAQARKVWLDFAERPDQVEHIFVFDADDAASQVLQRMHHLVMPAGGGCVAAWNMGAFATEAPVIVQMSDDWTPVPQWDRLILERLGDVNRPAVLAVSDGVRKDQLLCMAICTRQYFNADFFLFHPWFTGVYSDNWFTEQAYRRGVVVEARDLVFKHEHPLATGQPLDKTYSEQNAPERYQQGKAVLGELRAANDWSTVPGFFNYWPFYKCIADRLQDGDMVVEVGVWLGRSIIYLAQELKRQGKRVQLVAVDTFLGEADQPAHADVVQANGGSIRAAFEANIRRCGVADMIEIIEGDSAASAARIPDGSLAFCFIDAAHDYESVKRDLAAWEPKLRAPRGKEKGGIFAGHDAQWEPVMRAVQERLPQVGVFGPCWIRSGSASSPL